MPLIDARHRVRATRESGAQTRGTLLDAAWRLFEVRGFAAVSLGAIAAAADCFPSQITYYFGTKDALFAEAACREIVRLAERIEEVGAQARSPQSYSRAMATEAPASPALPAFCETLLIARRNPDVQQLVSATLEQLRQEGARAIEELWSRKGWRLTTPPQAISRVMWATALGLALEQAGTGIPIDPVAAESAIAAALGSDR
ncbi:TetR/AcrR family transcriptional regulator [Mycolicibacter senuensis]|uniref:TetR/AcrR family transcriptional regulator n=1 Tax=Mycolicibacter senuensis TaxID=386913 RepID=UPI0013D34001|nr:TetR/AcrR family transcriptional regulator [Mycolicibacter senuensis]